MVLQKSVSDVDVDRQPCQQQVIVGGENIPLIKYSDTFNTDTAIMSWQTHTTKGNDWSLVNVG